MIEINGNPNRRDLSEQNARASSPTPGVKICLNTDAHRVVTLDNMRYGIATARRAWLTKAEIANTRPWAQFQKLRKPGTRSLLASGVTGPMHTERNRSRVLSPLILIAMAAASAAG